MKKLYLTGFILLLTQFSMGQAIPSQDSLSAWFDRVKAASKKHHDLWSKDLYGPILLVNPQTRQLFANVPDSAGVLSPSGNVYSGTLPKNINVANTAVNWSGKRWAMIILPLPLPEDDRINLMAHELFHVSQPSLGFQLFNTDNNHLDQKYGRIWLRLELEALKNAIKASNAPERRKHLTNAVTFRKYRYILYPGAEKSENMLELNEGLAEYTGFTLSGRDKSQSAIHFVNGIDGFLTNPTFVRSFAYQTTPVYGYLLAGSKKSWNKEITLNTNLTEYFIRSFDLSLPEDLKKACDMALKGYNGEAIISEEIVREEEKLKQIAYYKNKFVVEQHFDLIFEQMNVSFDPRNIVPLEDKGTVYPNIRVTDRWGILTVTNGALMSPGWDKISVSAPSKTEGNVVSGEGWSLELKDGYGIVKDESSGNYLLSKK